MHAHDSRMQMQDFLVDVLLVHADRTCSYYPELAEPWVQGTGEPAEPWLDRVAAEGGVAPQAASRRVKSSQGAASGEGGVAGDMAADDSVAADGDMAAEGGVAAEEVPGLSSGGAALMIKFAYSDSNTWDHEMLFNDTRVFRSPGIFLHPVITPRYACMHTSRVFRSRGI